MTKMIQVRNVPEELHRTLKVRAAQAGMTLSDFLLAELREIARRPTFEELHARVATRGAVHLRTKTADAVRAERDA